MKKLALVIAVCALLCACKETIYSYQQFYENPQMAQEYVAKWEDRKNANQDQLALAKKAVDQQKSDLITFEEFCNTPGLADEYIEKWKNDPHANQNQLGEAYRARRYIRMNTPAPDFEF